MRNKPLLRLKNSMGLIHLSIMKPEARDSKDLSITLPHVTYGRLSKVVCGAIPRAVPKLHVMVANGS